MKNIVEIEDDNAVVSFDPGVGMMRGEFPGLARR